MVLQTRKVELYNITGEYIILVKFNSRDSADESSSEQIHSSLLEKIYMYVPQSRIATSNEDYVPRRDRFQFVSWKSNKFPRPARKESAKDSLSNFFHQMYGHFSSPSQRRWLTTRWGKQLNTKQENSPQVTCYAENLWPLLQNKQRLTSTHSYPSRTLRLETLLQPRSAGSNDCLRFQDTFVMLAGISSRLDMRSYIIYNTKHWPSHAN